MNEELLLAVQDCQVWLELFERRTYKKAFLRYREKYAEAFGQMLRICSSEEMLQSAADWMLTELEKSGYIGTESHDLSARTLMGMKMELNEEIDGYEIL